MASTDTMKDLIQCPICFSMMLGKIYMCSNGHDVCHRCFESLKFTPNSNSTHFSQATKKCPSCKVPFPRDMDKITRNRRLETVVQNCTLPCPYSEDGDCDQLELSGKERIRHVATCPHRTVKCPCNLHLTPNASNNHSNCNYYGTSDQLMQHAIDAHEFDIFEKKTSDKFEFQMDDISDGEGHYRIFLKGSNCEALLLGFKSANGEIALCVRTLKHWNVGNNYRINVILPAPSLKQRMESLFKKDKSKKAIDTISVQFGGKLRSIEDQGGVEFNSGDLLILSKSQVNLLNTWKNYQNKNNIIPMTIEIDTLDIKEVKCTKSPVSAKRASTKRSSASISSGRNQNSNSFKKQRVHSFAN